MYSSWGCFCQQLQTFSPVRVALAPPPAAGNRVQVTKAEAFGAEVCLPGMVRFIAYLLMRRQYKGRGLWRGGVLARNGKIYCVPFDAETVLVIDPAAQHVSCFGTVGSAKQKWWGGVLAPDGKIYCIPHNTDTVLVIDPASHTTSTFGKLPASSGKWRGGVIDNGLHIYGIPANATCVLGIDWFTQGAYTFGSVGSGDWKWCGGVLANNRIYCIPQSMAAILVIDPRSQDTTSIKCPASGKLRWGGGVLFDDGVIYCTPANANEILCISPLKGGEQSESTRQSLGEILPDENQVKEVESGSVWQKAEKLQSMPFEAESPVNMSAADPEVATETETQAVETHSAAVRLHQNDDAEQAREDEAEQLQKNPWVECHPVRARYPFNGQEHGPDYLVVSRGDALEEHAHPESDNAWKFARLYNDDGTIRALGWVPYYCTFAPSLAAREILNLFNDSGLPEEVAMKLVVPDGEFAYPDLVTFARLVTLEDLISAGLQVAPARLLKESLSPGGDVHTALVISGRLKPTKAEPPKLGQPSGSVNASDGGHASSNSSGTFVEVPRRIKDRVEMVQKQLSEQERLSRACGDSFETLAQAIDTAAARGVISAGQAQELRTVNHKANVAKHADFV